MSRPREENMHWPWAIGDDPVKGCWVLSNRWELQRTSWGKQILLWWGSLVEAKSWLSLSQVFPCRQWKVKITYIARTKYGWMVELKSKVPFQPFPRCGKDSSRTRHRLPFHLNLLLIWGDVEVGCQPDNTQDYKALPEVGNQTTHSGLGCAAKHETLSKDSSSDATPPWLLFPDVIRLRLECCLKSDTERRS